MTRDFDELLSDGRMDVMFLAVSVCLSARLLRKLRMAFDEIFGEVGCGSKTNRLDFGGAPDHDPDHGSGNFLKDSSFTIAISIDSQ